MGDVDARMGFRWGGIRSKLVLTSFVAVGGTALLLTAYFGRLLYRGQVQELEGRAARLAQNLARSGRDAVYSDDTFRQLPGLLNVVAKDPDLVGAAFFGRGGEPLSIVGRAPRPGPPGASLVWERVGSGDALEARVPVPAPEGAPEEAVGTVAVRLSWSRLRGVLIARLGIAFALAALVIVGAAAFVWVMMNGFLAPIPRILRADAEVQERDSRSGTIPPEEFPDDEIGEIMRSRAGMLFDLRLAEGQARALAVSEGRRADELAKALAELKDAKEELSRSEKLAALGRVLAGVAHELNNPLTGVLGYAQLLLEDESLAGLSSIRSDLEQILAEASRCQKVVADLCAFSRGERPAMAPLRLEDAVRRAVAAQRPLLDAAGVAVQEEYDLALPFLLADRAQLERCVINLLVNARHALEARKGGAVSVRTLLRNGRARIEVEDDGPGPAAEIEARLFEPFFSTKRLGKGTGLGLAVVRGNMEAHGGKAWFERPGPHGARFVLEFGAAAGVPAPQACPAPAQPAARAKAGLRVLVVDDEAEVRKVLARVLERLGHTPEAAADAQAALRLLEAGTYDCVLSDIRMPGQDGFDLLDAAVRLRPEIRDRWVFVTGSIEAETWRRVQETGLPSIQKPFAVEEVGRVLGGLPG